MVSSPVSPVFPTIPPKDTVNMHPYAIKTSSSAVLTRSNSTDNKSATSHHYTPPVPISPKTTKIRYVPRKDTFPTSSKDAPLPVPIPPPISGFISDGENVPPTPPLTVRVRRRESMPPMTHTRSDSEPVIEDLPPNPKLWTPSQLTTYLSSSLRLKGGAKPPVIVSRDIGTFVIKNQLNGRAFLRMKRQDYEHFDLNPLWKDALFDASRALRQSSVHDRIMGTLTSASLSVDDLPHLRDGNEDDSDNEDDNVPLPSYSHIASSWENNTRKRTIGRASLRPGRVRGMVRSFERSSSGSEASTSGSEYDESEPIASNHEFVAEAEGLPIGHDPTSSEDSTLSSSMEHGATQSSEVTQAEAFITFSPPRIESSIEDLLKVEPEVRLDRSDTHQYRSWGARAWEEEHADLAHLTAKKLPLTEAHPVTMHIVHNADQPVVLSELFQDINVTQVTTNSAPERVATLPSKTEASVDTADDVETWRKEVNIGTELSHLPTRHEMSVSTDGIIEALPTIPDISPDIYTTLQAIQERLEHVEKRLDELERREAEWDVQQAKSTSEQQTQAIDKEEEEEEQIPLSIEKEERNHNSIGEEEAPSADPHVIPVLQDRNYAAAEPATLGGLPGYVLLISIGVVAMTMRVVLVRMLGNRRR